MALEMLYLVGSGIFVFSLTLPVSVAETRYPNIAGILSSVELENHCTITYELPYVNKLKLLSTIPQNDVCFKERMENDNFAMPDQPKLMPNFFSPALPFYLVVGETVNLIFDNAVHHLAKYFPGFAVNQMAVIPTEQSCNHGYMVFIAESDRFEKYELDNFTPEKIEQLKMSDQGFVRSFRYTTEEYHESSLLYYSAIFNKFADIGDILIDRQAYFTQWILSKS